MGRGWWGVSSLDFPGGAVIRSVNLRDPDYRVLYAVGNTLTVENLSTKEISTTDVPLVRSLLLAGRVVIDQPERKDQP